ncbi:hypothetical protein I4U23_027548 [Adineta vaga]|nr:hypothetical protein I4U23_027548 [Adineta vaga]
MQSQCQDDNFRCTRSVGTDTTDLIQNSIKLEIVNDLEEIYRPRYKSDYFSQNGRIRKPRYVADRVGNHYVTLKMTSNIQGRVQVHWVTLPDSTGRRYIMPYRFQVSTWSPDIPDSNPIVCDIETDSNGFMKVYLVLLKAKQNELRKLQPLVPFSSVKDALHNSHMSYYRPISPKELIHKFQLDRSQLAFTLYTTTDGILYVTQWHTTVFSTVLTVSFSFDSTAKTNERTWEIVSSTFSQYNLRKLSLSNVEIEWEYVTWPNQWKLEHLAIDDCTCSAYRLILQQLPNLRTFSISDLITNEVEIQGLSTSNTTFTTVLESLTMTRCSLLSNHLELLLALTPSLRQLRLASHRKVFDSFFDATHWGKLISIKLSELRKFEFIFFHTYSSNDDSINIKLLTASFRSSFWLDKKQRFVVGAYVLEQDEIWLYTTPIDFFRVRNFARLETLWTDNAYHLTQRPLYKMLDSTSDKVYMNIYRIPFIDNVCMVMKFVF